jgi:hypothetical protein
MPQVDAGVGLYGTTHGVCALVIELIPINKTNKDTLVKERIRIFFLLV